MHEHLSEEELLLIRMFILTYQGLPLLPDLLFDIIEEFEYH